MSADKILSFRLLLGFSIGLGLALVFQIFNFPVKPLLSGAHLIGEVFLRGIFMLILPLTLPMLLLGIQRLTETGVMGRIGFHTLWTVLTLTAIAALIGLVLANLMLPGALLSPQARTLLFERFGSSSLQPKALTPEFFLTLLPKNPLHEMAMAFTSGQQGGLLAVVSFTILMGIALAKLPAEQTQPLYHLLELLYRASAWLLFLIMRWIAPFGIAALIFQAVLSLGWEFFLILGAYAGTVAVGLLIHGLGVYSIFLRVGAQVSPLKTLRGSAPALLMAFSSASSNATLPTSLKVAVERLGIASPVAQFILTLGATVNQNGTALYEGVTLLFLMQVFGVPLSLPEQALVIALAILIAIGAAGVPGGSLPLLAGVLPTFGVPSAAIALIYGIDRLLDMMRTTVNVYGDLVIAAYLNRLYYGSAGDTGSA
ncbi:MAG: dicarboxylate/amino acid:cation symporter [Bacteroidia bacterium]|nr:dicarboxylate/amino acid:cation symporter [Bacteroidia bacterium]MDW8014668.1 dicarboxylate/amino acid:cation symporter [Bacteroidia bacterium]